MMLLSHHFRTAMAEGLRVALASGPNPARLEFFTSSNAMLGAFDLPPLDLASHGTLRMPGPALPSLNSGAAGTVAKFRLSSSLGGTIDGTVSLTAGDIVADDVTVLNAANHWLDALTIHVGLTGTVTIQAFFTPNAP